MVESTLEYDDSNLFFDDVGMEIYQVLFKSLIF